MGWEPPSPDWGVFGPPGRTRPDDPQGQSHQVFLRRLREEGDWLIAEGLVDGQEASIGISKATIEGWPREAVERFARERLPDFVVAAAWGRSHRR